VEKEGRNRLKTREKEDEVPQHVNNELGTNPNGMLATAKNQLPRSGWV
jgi:hypothetical protein